MSENLTTTNEISPAMDVFYNRQLLATPTPRYVHAKFGQRASIPRGSGRTMKWRRYNRLSAATTPISEGVTPNGSQLSMLDITAQASQFGDFIHITDVVDLTTPDKVISEGVDKLADQMRNTEDQLVRDVLAACASATTCSNGSPTATLLNKTDIDAVAQTLLGGLAEFMTPAIKAGTGQGTSPIRPSFWGILDTDLIDDIEAVSGFKAVVNYASAGGTDEAEWGSTGNVRWLYTTEGYNSSGMYFCPIIGKNAFGIVDIAGGNAKSIIKPFGSGNDPLNQRMTAGWKFWNVCRILNDSYMHILKCTNG